MVYITFPVTPSSRQMTFEEMLANIDISKLMRNQDTTSSRTVLCNRVPDRVMSVTNVPDMIAKLEVFNKSYEHLLAAERHSLYKDRYYIPKKSYHKKKAAGQPTSKKDWRPIDEPKPELMNALRVLQSILKSFMLCDHHTSAYAYIDGRSTIQCVQKHQRQDNHWFGKFDFSGFFPSITPEYVMYMFEMIYPFNLILQDRRGAEALRKAVELGFLDNSLPQGTPLSPWLTNVIMIPFDHTMANALIKFPNEKGGTDRITYTRYADDINVSCKVQYDIKKVERQIVNTLEKFHAPFSLNTEKTHYGSRSGHNFALGVCLNKDNKITLGHRRNKEMKAMVNNYILDKKNGKPWNIEELAILRGNLNYFNQVDSETFAYVVNFFENKYGVNVMDSIAVDMSA